MPTTRREFLSLSLGGAAVASLGPAMPAFWARTAAAAASARADGGDTVLIVVQLAGGNDGLNTVVPYADDAYARNRKTLRLTGDQVHRIDDQLGFHPKMAALKRLYDEGLLTVVQGVAYPNQSDSHPRSMEIWQTAMPDETSCQTGWLGRALDEHCGATEVNDPAVFVGRIPRPLALNAERVFVPSVRSLEQCTLKAIGGPTAGQPDRQLLAGAAETARAGDDNPLLDFLQEGIRSAGAASDKIKQVAGQWTPGPDYPSFQLAQSLGIAAQLIRAELGIRVFFTELGGGSPGGFDNHANQLGNHDALLRELSESVAALADDLKRDRLLDRVVLMTFSEFGRTLVENGRRGTGHGEAAPMFLVGGALRGGLVGPHPSLTDLRKGSPKFHTDFRRVYATVLDRWLGFDSQAALGRRFEPLEVLA